MWRRRTGVAGHRANEDNDFASDAQRTGEPREHAKSDDLAVCSRAGGPGSGHYNWAWGRSQLPTVAPGAANWSRYASELVRTRTADPTGLGNSSIRQIRALSLPCLAGGVKDQVTQDCQAQVSQDMPVYLRLSPRVPSPR